MSYNPSWMTEALTEARRAADQGEVPVGAIVVHGGQIIGRGRNDREQIQDPISHAEIHAIRGAAKQIGSWRLIDCDVYVTLEPCPMCLGALQQARVRVVYYGAADPKGGALSLGYRLNDDPRTNHRFSAELKETDSCAAVLRDFFRDQRKAQR